MNTGRYFNDRMDAEWEFCSLAFEWFQDNVLISYEEDEEYKRSPDEARVEALEENLSAAHRSLAAAMDLVEELILEHERLCPKEDRVTDEPIEKVAKDFAKDYVNRKRDSDTVDAIIEGIRASYQLFKSANVF